MPNAMGPVLVAATFGVANAILIEAGLSFLGLGDPSAPSWGVLLKDGRDYKNFSTMFLPGLAIFFTVSILNIMGEGLRDAMDPKLRR
jgi:peptide/nickel transport system permease protein